ncbi:MAG: amidohydrolase family protein [Nitrospinota bacterium]
MKVDVHGHFFSREYLERAVSLSTARPERDPYWRDHMNNRLLPDPAMWSLEGRVEKLDEEGVDFQVLSMVGPMVYFDDAKAAAEMARISNDAIADACSRHPRRFGGLACLPLTAGVDASLAELRRSLEDSGLWGITVGANVAGRTLDDPVFWPVYEELNRLRLPALIHPMVSAGVEMLGDFFLISAVGFMFDTTAAVARLLFKGVLERFPEIRFIIPHMGATVPYLAGRWESAYSRGGPAQEQISHPPSYYLKRLHYDCLGFQPASLRCAQEVIGCGRFLFGTDFPFHKSMKPAMRLIEAMEWTPEEKEAVFHRTAKGLFPKLPAPKTDDGEGKVQEDRGTPEPGEVGHIQRISRTPHLLKDASASADLSR